MTGGRESRVLREHLASMSNMEIEAALRAPLRAPLGVAGQDQAEPLPDLAWAQLRMRSRARDSQWAGACLALAERSYASRKYALAGEAAAQAAGAYRRLEEAPAGATCDLLEAASLVKLGQYAKALSASERAKATFAAHARAADVGICDYLRGKSWASMGRYQDALQAYEAGRQLLLAADEIADAGRCDFERGKVLQALERHEEAIQAYDAAERLFQRARLPADAAACRAARGIGLQGLGRYRDAIAAYEAAKQVFRRLGMPAEAAACDCSRGVALQSLERYQEAIAAYEAARPVLLAHDRLADAAACEAGRGAALDSLGEYGKAVAAFQVAASYYMTCHEVIAAARCNLERGNALQALGRYEEAIAAYRQAKAAYAEQGQVVDAARCEANRGVALSRLGQYQKAITSFAAACPVLEGFEQWRALAWAHCGLATCRRALGDPGASLASYLAACESLESAVEAASGEGKEFSDFREEFPEPFVPAMLLYLERARSAATGEKTATGEVAAAREEAAARDEEAAAREEGFILAERRRSAAFRRDVVHSLRRGSLDLDSRSPRLLAEWQAIKREQASLAGNVRQAGKRGSAQLSRAAADVAQTRERLRLELARVEEDLFAADPEAAGLISRRLPMLAATLGSLVDGEGLISYLESGEDLVCLLVDRGSVAAARLLVGGGRLVREASARFETELLSLGALLLGPAQDLGWLEDGPAGKSRLRIVPSPSLFAVPFAALGIPGRRDYIPVISQAEVVLAPQAVTALYQRDKGSRDTGLIFLGEPGDARARDIARVMDSAQPGMPVHHQERGESERSLADVIRGHSHLHLSRGSAFSSAALGPASISQLYEVADRLDLAFIEIPRDGLGLLEATRDLLPLVRAWLRVSRQIVLAPAIDRGDGTTDLVLDFYEAIGRGQEPVTALARAQRRYVAAAQTGADRPLPWSRFVVMG
jgi:tetratricopeptide (TPR) repeat protein